MKKFVHVRMNVFLCTKSQKYASLVKKLKEDLACSGMKEEMEMRRKVMLKVIAINTDDDTMEVDVEKKKTSRRETRRVVQEIKCEPEETFWTFKM